MRKLEQLLLITLGITIAAGSFYLVFHLLQNGGSGSKTYPALLYSKGNTEWVMMSKNQNPHFLGYEGDSTVVFRTSRASKAIWKYNEHMTISLQNNAELQILRTSTSPYQMEIKKGQVSFEVRDTSRLQIHTPAGLFSLLPDDKDARAVINQKDSLHYTISLHRGRMVPSASVRHSPSNIELNANRAFKIDIKANGRAEINPILLPPQPQFRYPKNEMGFSLGELHRGLRLTWDSTLSATTELRFQRQAANGNMLIDWNSTDQATQLWRTNSPGTYLLQLRSISEKAAVSSWSKPISVGVAAQFRDSDVKEHAQVRRPSLKTKRLVNGYIAGGYIQPETDQNSTSYHLIIYAKPDDDHWFIQPRTDNFIIPVMQDGYWETYIHQADSLGLYWTSTQKLPKQLPKTVQRLSELRRLDEWNRVRYMITDQ